MGQLFLELLTRDINFVISSYSSTSLLSGKDQIVKKLARRY